MINIQEIINKTARDLNLPREEVSNIYYHYVKTVKNQLGSLDRVFEEIKIPYLGTLTFNKKRHDKIQNHIANKNKEDKCKI